ncbi:MAG: S8 family serine peptidase [Candidatus Aenigmarchaeota archaeon]|nr:S8 family serine peptidase [Candidatus Aenigmarchaeota archaeon]
MKVNYLSVLVAVALVISATAILAVSVQPHGNGKARVIAHTEKEVSDALAKGCKVVRDAKTLKALTCPEAAASELGLQEDVRVFALDTKSNVQINADDVHLVGNTGAGRLVAVLDTGVDYNHVQLSDSIVKGRDFVDDDNDPMDLNGHGTHVAGIITANSGTAKGVAPDANVLAVRVLDASGSGFFSDVVAAIYYVVDGPDGLAGTADDFSADAISMSLGTSQPYTYKGFCDNVLPDMTNAIKYARDKNVLVVSAAGNSGGAGVSIPGCISYSTTVGAVDSTDKVARFSGRGNAVDITAPGVGIYSTWLNGGFATASGTSMATPMVSATAALVKAVNPAYTDEQVEQALTKTAKDLGKAGFDTSYGWGRVDALGAVNYIAA